MIRNCNSFFQNQWSELFIWLYKIVIWKIKTFHSRSISLILLYPLETMILKKTAFNHFWIMLYYRRHAIRKATMTRPIRWWFVVAGSLQMQGLIFVTTKGKLKIRGDNKKSLYPAVTEVRLLTEEENQTQEEKSNKSVKMQPVKKLVKEGMEENSQESQHFMLKWTNIWPQPATTPTVLL